MVWWHRYPGVLRWHCVPRFDSALPSALRAVSFSSVDQPVPRHCPGSGRSHVVWLDYLIRFDGTSFHRYEGKEGFPPGKTSYAVGQDDTGKVWIGQHGHQNELWCYADGTFQSVQVDLGGALRKIQCDSEGRMWFCTLEGVLYQDGDGFSRFTLADGLPHPAVKAVFQDREQQLWFATWGGIGLYDVHSISVFNLSAKSSKGASQISQIVQDRRGDIWIGYASPILNYVPQSVFRFDGEHFTYIDTKKGLDINNCFAIYEDLDGSPVVRRSQGPVPLRRAEAKKNANIRKFRQKEYQRNRPG